MITIDPQAAPGTALSAAGLSRFLKRACLLIELPGEVEVLLSDDLTLRRLNKAFRGKNKSTDVLSFPPPAGFSAIHAGDLAISLETAARQAAEYGHSLRDEVRILLLHGVLHLSGLDHEIDQGEMAAREAALRRELRLPHTLIERTHRRGGKAGSLPGSALPRVSLSGASLSGASLSGSLVSARAGRPAKKRAKAQ